MWLVVTVPVGVSCARTTPKHTLLLKPIGLGKSVYVMVGVYRSVCIARAPTNTHRPPTYRNKGR